MEKFTIEFRYTRSWKNLPKVWYEWQKLRSYPTRKRADQAFNTLSRKSDSDSWEYRKAYE